MIQRLHIFGDLSQMGTDAEVLAEALALEEVEAEMEKAEAEEAEADRIQDEAAKRGRRGLKKIK